MLDVKKLKSEKFFIGKPYQNYRVSLAIWDHNVTCNPTHAMLIIVLFVLSH